MGKEEGMNERKTGKETVRKDHSLGRHTQMGTSQDILGQQTVQFGWR